MLTMQHYYISVLAWIEHASIHPSICCGHSSLSRDLTPTSPQALSSTLPWSHQGTPQANQEMQSVQHILGLVWHLLLVGHP